MLTCKGMCYHEGNTQSECMSPTVKIKQTPNTDHLFSIRFSMWQNKLPYVLLLEGRRIIFPINSPLLIASRIFPRSSVITLQRYSKQARQAAFCRPVCLPSARLLGVCSWLQGACLGCTAKGRRSCSCECKVCFKAKASARTWMDDEAEAPITSYTVKTDYPAWFSFHL